MAEPAHSPHESDEEGAHTAHPEQPHPPPSLASEPEIRLIEVTPDTEVCVSLRNFPSCRKTHASPACSSVIHLTCNTMHRLWSLYRRRLGSRVAIYGPHFQELDFNQGRLRKIEGLEGLVNLKVGQLRCKAHADSTTGAVYAAESDQEDRGPRDAR